MASNIPRAVSRKKLRLGQQLAVLETHAPDLPSVAELHLSFAKRPGSHTGARKFMRLNLPALIKQNPKITQSLAVDYSDKPDPDVKPILSFKTTDGQSVDMDLSGKHSTSIMTELQQAAFNPKAYLESMTPVQPKKPSSTSGA